MTAGTKTALTLSAKREIGAFEALASSTRLMIFESVVSSRHALLHRPYVHY